MIESWLPWIVLAVAGASVPLFRTTSDTSADPEMKQAAHFSGGVCALVALVFAGLAFSLQSRQPSILPIGLGIALGCVFGAGCGFLGSRFDPLHKNRLAPAALGLGIAYLAQLAPIEARTFVALGVTAGFGLATWIVGAAPTPWPALASMGSLAVLFGMAVQTNTSLPSATAAWGLAILVAFFYELARSGLKQKLPNIAGHVLVGGLASLVVWQLAKALTWPQATAEILAVGIAFGALACVVAELMEDQPLVGALVGAGAVALGTSGFLWAGEDGSIWILIGYMAIPTLRGSKAAMASISSLGALAFMYVAKYLGFDNKIQFELGRHYILTGLTLGIAVPLLLGEWQSKFDKSRGSKNVIAMALMLGAFVAACYAIRAQISEDTLFGLLIGLCLSGAVSLFGNQNPQRITALGFSLACFILALAIPSDPGMVELARDERIRLVLIMSICVFACVLGAVALAGRRTDSQPVSNQPIG